MHSSRMRTGRLLTVCLSVLPEGGCLLPGGMSARGGWCLLRGGDVCSGGGGFLTAWGGVLPGRGVSAPRGVLPRQGGCLLPGGVSLPGDPPPVNRITHTCKNITLATTSLRPVIR